MRDGMHRMVIVRRQGFGNSCGNLRIVHGATHGSGDEAQERSEQEGKDAKSRNPPWSRFLTKERGKGTGLGLSMVHGLAGQLNGVLRLTSQVGRATTAGRWLKVTTIAAEQSNARLGRGMTRQATNLLSWLRTTKLCRQEHSQRAGGPGHDVIEASSGDSALDIDRDGRAVDLLNTDFSMPRVNGAQLATAVERFVPSGQSFWRRGCGTAGGIRRGLATDRKALSAGPARGRDHEGGEAKCRRGHVALNRPIIVARNA